MGAWGGMPQYYEPTKRDNKLSDMGRNFFFESFGEDINSKLLSAFCEREGLTFNIFWKKIDKNVASYRVELYKYHDSQVFHLKNIEVNRNDGFACIQGMVGDGYIFRVVAESRDGSILATHTI